MQMKRKRIITEYHPDIIEIMPCIAICKWPSLEINFSFLAWSVNVSLSTLEGR